ncbi:hypothetical protein GDO86_013735 [Hymenochirus boettgeri]|uniref:RING-type domain-containing protein n=1 Tax=Hymenochirus boettgeri TaxID=247094 RepID=A0A8T2JNY7_9PIPI|nr:hypothetical protein GDO86_013735 [Hymenochirus boettgeri]
MEGTVLCLQPDDLCCPICVCTFSYPCSLPCGHSFCRQCIGTHWKTSTRISCPLCNETLQNRPNLSKNTVLASIVERLQSQAEHCNSCMGPGATQLCLPCLAPLCPQHLPLHQNESTHHLLVNLPTVWPCRYHEHGLQFYCARHSATLCPNCVVQHKECPAVPLLQHYKSNQEKIQKTLSKIIQEIAVKEEELIMKRNAHREYQIEVCDVTDKLIRDFQEMTDYLRRQRGALLGRIREGQETAQKEMVKSVTATQIEIDQLQRVKAQLEGKLSSDWMEVLKEPNCDTYQTSPTEHQDHQFNVNRIIEIAQLTDNIKQSLLAHPLLENAPSPLKQVTEVNTEPHNDSPTANDHPLPTHHLEEPAQDVVHFTEEMTEPHNDSLMENNHSLLPQRLEESVRDVQHCKGYNVMVSSYFSFQ